MELERRGFYATPMENKLHTVKGTKLRAKQPLPERTRFSDRIRGMTGGVTPRPLPEIMSQIDVEIEPTAECSYGDTVTVELNIYRTIVESLHCFGIYPYQGIYLPIHHRIQVSPLREENGM
jgi:hypothetical protein